MKYLLFCVGILAFLFAVFSLIKRKDAEVRTNFGIEWTNAVKGFAIIIIVLSHLSNYFGIRYMNPFGSIGVACFFICSGFGLEASYQKSGLDNFWKKKLSIYFIYITVEIIGYFTLWKPEKITDVFYDLLFIITLHPFGWYLSVLLIWYLVFYLEKRFGFKYGSILFLTVSSALFLFSYSLAAENAFSFPLGILLYKYKDRIFPFLQKIRFCVFALFISMTFLAIKQISFIRMFNISVNFVSLMTAVFFAFAVFSFVSIIQKYNIKYIIRFLAYVGTISYEIYLTHAFLMLLIEGHYGYFTLLLFFIFTVAFSVLLFYYKKYVIEKITKIIIMRSKNAKT